LFTGWNWITCRIVSNRNLYAVANGYSDIHYHKYANFYGYHGADTNFDIYKYANPICNFYSYVQTNGNPQTNSDIDIYQHLGSLHSPYFK
jgi:hypothetical protein